MIVESPLPLVILEAREPYPDCPSGRNGIPGFRYFPARVHLCSIPGRTRDQ